MLRNPFSQFTIPVVYTTQYVYTLFIYLITVGSLIRVQNLFACSNLSQTHKISHHPSVSNHFLSCFLWFTRMFPFTRTGSRVVGSMAKSILS